VAWLPIHRGEAVNTFLRTTNHGIIQLEQLPAYRPELNADEQVWSYITALFRTIDAGSGVRNLDFAVKSRFDTPEKLCNTTE